MTEIRTVGSSDDLAAEHLCHTGRLVPVDLGRIHILQIFLGILVRERPYQGRDIGIFPVKASHQTLDLLRLDKRFIALDIDDDRIVVVLFAPGWGSDGFVGLQTAVRTAFMVGTCHDHFTTKSLYRIVDAFIVRSYHHGAQSFGRLFVHTVYHRAVTNLCQRLTRETRRGVSCRDNSYKFHSSPFSILVRSVIAPAIVFTFVMVTIRRPVGIPFLSFSSCSRQRSGRVTAYWTMLPNISDCQ